MDELVASAVSHWGPRFTVNGVTVGRLRAGHRRAWSAGRTGAPPGSAAGVRARGAGPRRAGRGPASARPASTSPRPRSTTTSRKFVFVEDLDQMRAAHARAVACLDDALPHLDPPGRRVEIPFEGSRLVGVLRVPAGDGPHPVVVLLIPGLDSTKEELRSTEETFLDRGLATFSVDGPGSGRGGVRPADPRRLVAGRRGALDALGALARGRLRPARRLGRQPRRLLRAAGRGRRSATGSRPASPWPGRSTSASAGTACRS